MIPTNPQEYEPKNSVVVPLAFFDKLMRCYYGTGPRDGEPQYQVVPESAATEVITEMSDLKDTTIGMMAPKGYQAKGVAEKKLKAKQSGIRHDKTTQEQA